MENALEKRKEFYDKMTDEMGKAVDYFACYMLLASRQMKDSESLTFPDPTWYSKPKFKRYLTLTNKGVKDYSGELEEVSHHLKYILKSSQLGSFSVNTMKEIIISLKTSPIDKRITDEMVERKYNEYHELRKRFPKKKAIEIFLSRY